MARTIEIKITADTKQADASIQGFERRFKSAIDSTTGSVGKLRSSLGGLNTALTALGGALAFKQIAQFGIDLDRSRNAMTALTGSVENANKKLAELRELAKASPGVTNTFAVQLFNQLKAVGGIADQTINQVIKSLGKLNTVFSDVGPEFARNLVQIFQQGFERSDIKEALGRVPIFEQLLEQAFGTKDPDKLRKAKEAGKLTLNTFLTGFSEAINSDARFKNIQESLGGRLAKSFDDVKQRLGELGERLLRDLLPALEKLLPVASSILKIFSELPVGLQAATLAFIAMPGPITAVAGAIKGLAASILGLGAAGASPGVAKVLAFLGTPAGAALGLGGIGAAGLGLGLFEADRQAGEFNARLQSQLERQQAGRTPFLDPAREAEFQAQQAAIQLALKSGTLTPELKAALAGGSKRSAASPFLDLSNFAGGGKTGKAKSATSAIDLLFFAQSRQTDRAAIERATEDHFSDLSRIELQRQKDEAQAFGGIVKEIQKNREDAAEAAKKAQEALAKLPPILSDSERFMKGFADATLTAGDAFEQFGANVAHAFTNIRDLFGGLKRAVLDFFNSLVGSALQNLVKSTLGGLFGGGGGGGGGGIGGLFGNLFRTPSFAGAGGSGGLSAPPSVSGTATGIFANGQFAAGLRRESGIDEFFGAGVPRTAGSIAGGSFLGNLGRSFAGALPLLGLSFGSSLGGQSTAGNILGGIGGLALSFAPFLAAPLLIGSFLFGKASQRKKDEEASGQMLTQALQGIDQLAQAVGSGQITSLGEARQVFESQILGTFIQGINTLKTESVRKSRLTNQVRDLRKVFEDRIPPAFAEQERKAAEASRFAAIDSRLIPQFAGGGTVPGVDRGFDSVRALLRPGEMVLTQAQQSAIALRGGTDIFRSAGVPGVQPQATFQHGGIAPGGSQSSGPMVIQLDVQLGMTEDDTRQIVARGMNTRTGEDIIVELNQRARRRRST